MTTRVRRLSVIAVALSFALSSLPSPAFANEAEDSAQALGLLNRGCGTTVAQVTPSPEPVASAPPTGSPTPAPYVGAPGAPTGPQILIPPPASQSPGVTPPPVPSLSPLPNGSPGPVIITPQSPPPPVSPIPASASSAGPIGLRSPSPAPSPAAGEILDPNTYAILGDKLTGIDKPGEPFDLDGHVNVFYQDGVLGGDHAHYDGQRYIDVTGNTFVINREGDTRLFADAIRFDTMTQKATLLRGHGESTQGVEQGRLHFQGSSMVSDRNGVTHVERANLTTCENSRGGYHIESKTLDVYPGDKAVARSAVLFLGALAVLYLPILIISLRQDEPGSRRNPGFLPLIGYDSAEGFFIKARIGFSPSDYYYGYYRVEEFTKIGLGLGYVGTIRRKDGRRQTDINFYHLNSNNSSGGGGGSNSNLSIQDQEAFSRSTRGEFGLNYTDNYGPLVTLPAQYDLTAAVDHGDAKGDRQNYSFHRSATGSQASTDDYGVSDHRQFSNTFTNDSTVSYTTSQNTGFPGTTTLHYETLTHYSGRSYDYDLTFDRYDTSTPTNVQKEPELAIRPHDSLIPGFKAVPITAQYTLGIYDDPQAAPNGPTTGLTTARGEARLQIGPGLAHVFGSDFSGTVTVQQDAYGTGDLKAQIGQQATFTTPLFGHIINVISYNESHVNGPLAEPFKSIDVLGDGTKQANDVLRIFNSDIYSLSLTGTTFFNRQAQAVGYQLQMRPSPRSTLLIGGNFNPGPGNGFDRTSVQLSTPFGYESDLQFATFIDWKARGRFESKNIYYRHVIGECYEIRLSYNEDLKQVTASVDLLAFPSRALNFGLASTSLSSIIPGSFSTSAFTSGTAAP